MMTKWMRVAALAALVLALGAGCGDSGSIAPDGPSGRDGAGDGPTIDDGGGGGERTVRDGGGSDADGGGGGDAGVDAPSARYAQPNTAWQSAPLAGATVEVIKLALDPSNGDIVVLLRFSGGLSAYNTTYSAEGAVDAALMRFDAAGTFKWAVHIRGTGEARVHDMAIDSTGRTYIVGEYTGQLIFGSSSLVATGTDGMMLTVNANGAPYVLKHFDTASGSSVLRGVAIGANDSVLLAGELDSAATIDGQSLSNTAGGGDIVLLKLVPLALTISDKRVIGGVKDDAQVRLTALSSSEFLLTGESSASFAVDGKNVSVQSGPDLFAMKLDGSFAAQWATTFVGKASGKRDDVINDVVVASSSRVLLCGHYGEQLDVGAVTLKKAASAQTSDGWLAALDPASGAPAYAIRFGGDGAGEQGCDAMGVASSSHVVVFAHVKGQTTVAGKPVAASDGQLVLRMAQSTGGFDGVFAYGGDLQVNDTVWDSAGVVAGGRFSGPLTLATTSISSSGSGPDGLLWRLTLPGGP